MGDYEIGKDVLLLHQKLDEANERLDQLARMIGALIEERKDEVKTTRG